MRIRGKYTGGSVLAAVAALTVALSACSPSLEQPSDLPPGAEPELTLSAPAPTTSANHADGHQCAIADITVEGASGRKPKIEVPEDCEPPAEVLRKDLDKGTGPPVKPGARVEVNYILVTLSDGTEVDTSWTSETASESTSVTVGQSEVALWNEGLVGMREGGRRVLVVPAGEHDVADAPDDALVVVFGITKVG